MARTLYEIRQDLESCIDPETGEIDEELWDDLYLEWEQKVEGVVLYIKNQTALVDGMKQEKENLELRIKSANKQIEGLKGWLYKAIVEMGGKEKFETPKAKVTFRQSSSVDIIGEELIPDKFFDIQVVRKPAKKLIKAAIESGEKVPGAVIVNKMNPQIK